PSRVLKTLDRIISKAGVGSRTEARSWIGAGRVSVNGKVVQTPDHWVDARRDKVTLDGKPLEPVRKRYILLYKPRGYLTTYRDPQGRPTVYDLLGDVKEFVGQVGRLDLESSGLLLLTNDTQFAEALTNPQYHVPKTYLVKAAGLLSDEQLDKLRSGVELNDGKTRPATVARVRDSEKYTNIEMTITEGRNRQVRRMFEAIDSHVVKLVRTRIGKLTLDGLAIGKWRDLTSAEVAQLQKVVLPRTAKRRLR
ncbi:MAG TPA: pseudouridine synthase, partial [Bryobacteraceae bacterium]